MDSNNYVYQLLDLKSPKTVPLLRQYKIFKVLPGMIICSYHVTYVFQSESTLCSCLTVKELLARNIRDIWNLSDSNEIRTHNHLVRKWTLNHLARVSGYELSRCGLESRCCHLTCRFSSICGIYTRTTAEGNVA